MKNKKTTNMVIFSMLLAIEVVMSFTPLGFLRIGLLSVTMLHIPVIICAMALGKKYGAALGFVMGFCSFYNATFSPTITSFCFTPFFSMGGVEGNWIVNSGVAKVFGEYDAEGKLIREFAYECDMQNYRTFKYDYTGFWFK